MYKPDTTAFTNYIIQNRRRRWWKQLVKVLGCVVVFCTTYALILPALTMEKDLVCGIEEHTHDASCYRQITTEEEVRLLCDDGSLGVHSHSEDCFDANGNVICGYADFIVHEHSPLCFGEDGSLVCPLPEIKAHTHGDECFATVAALSEHSHDDSCFTTQRGRQICGLEESEGHAHTDECYVPGDLICQIPESAGHTHDALCTVEELACELVSVPHQHAEACTQRQLTCTLPEDENHAHEDGCFEAVLTCTTVEDPHTHTDSCWEITYSCGLEETLGHTHSDDCRQQTLGCGKDAQESHTHSDACYETIQVQLCSQDAGAAEAAEGAEEPAAAAKTLSCTENEIRLHTHDDDCWETYTDEAGEAHMVLTCKEPEIREHIHTESCMKTIEVPAEDVDKLTCGLEETESHSHSAMCYGTWVLSCTQAEHTHGESCYPPDVCYCGQEAHSHGEGCIDAEGNLLCTLPEHTHSEACAEAPEAVYYCGLDIHSHSETCFGPEGTLICGSEEHSHSEACHTPPADTEYYCGMEEHTHSADCYDEAGDQICELEEHSHSGECLTVSKACAYHCGLEEHGHDASCFDPEGNLLCQQGEHIHKALCLADLNGLEEDDRVRVEYIIQQIDDLLSPDEIDAKLAEFEASGDENAMMEWEEELYRTVFDVYTWYSHMDEDLKPYVVNSDELMELEYIWSMAPLLYANGIDSDPVSTVAYAPTSDFVKLNLYDYHGTLNSSEYTNINQRWKNDSKQYPGFQWNAGAYPYKYRRSSDGAIASPFDWIANRNLVDCLDFGNSLITDYQITDLYVPNFESAATSPWYKGDKSVSAIGVANKDGANGAINAITFGEFQGRQSNTDHPIGVSVGKALSIASQMTYDNNDYYPHLANAASATYGRSLRYLFDGAHPGRYAHKQNTANIDGLFQRDPVSGEYYYDSRLNHAQFNAATNKFVLYDQIITPNFILYPFGNFLPLNDITNEADATQVSAFDHAGGVMNYIQSVINNLEAKNPNLTNSERQLVRMLYSYRFSWENWGNPKRDTWKRWGNINAKDALNDYFDNSDEFSDEGVDFYRDDLQALLTELYNIDYDVPKNFFFGMDMEMEFFQPKDGMTGNDTNQDGNPDYPMVFYFAGDDDVWVYIDNTLFLDLTGIHRHVGGKIDFVNGVVSYYAMDSYVNGAVESTPYFTMTFAEILKKHGGIAEADLGKYLKKVNGQYTTFLDYSTHTFNFYYMERGSGSSVCRINFNFPMLRKNSITVTKQNVPDADVAALGNPDYYFSIIPEKNAQKPLVGPDSVTGVSTYTILDSGGNAVGTGTVDQYGIFKLKAGQSAVFKDISENVGQFHVQELIPEVDDAQYGKDVTINGKPHRNGDLIDWSQRPWYKGDTSQDKNLGPYNTRWYAYSSQATEASSNSSFYFEARNGVKTAKLGALSLTKILNTIDGSWQDAAFRFRVELDGGALPVGTVYTVIAADDTVTDKTVTEAGYVELRGGQTATIPNITSGTKFFVKEELAQDADLEVSYTVIQDEDTVDYPNGGISGIVRTGTTVGLRIVNSDGTSVQIPGTKKVANPDNIAREYTFSLVQVDDAYNPLTGAAAYTQTVTVSGGEPVDYRFQISYQNDAFDTFPVTCYYRITEDVVDNALENTTVYIAKVTINGTANNMTAELTGMLVGRMEGDVPVDLVDSSAMSADFTNTLVSDLVISKTVSGSQTDQEFTFNLTIGTQDQRFMAVTSDGEPLEFIGGTNNTFALKHGESLTVLNVPVGTHWSVTEDPAEGFETSCEVTVNGTTTAGNSGTIVVGGNTVAFTNTQLYILPETGGAGTTPYTTVGLGLILISMACLLYKLPLRRRGDP